MINRYQSIRTARLNATGSQYYLNNVYPDIPQTEQDNYVTAVLGDRLDLLANDFYGDPSLWWIIASANSLPGDSLYLEPGLQVRIPNDAVQVLSQYDKTNLLR